MKAITIILVLGLIALVAMVSASAASQGGNGKMMQTGSNPQDGTGNPYGGATSQNGGNQFGNGTCIREDCPNNGTPLRDGTGRQYGKSGKGNNSKGLCCRSTT